MSALKDSQHRNIAFWGMSMIAMGLPTSVFLVSIGTFVLAGNWLLEGGFRKRLTKFFSNPLSLIIISIFLIHLIGMIWTENYGQGLKDLRIKLPILLIPLFLFTSKMPDRRRLQDVLMLFVLACVVGSIFGMLRYWGITGGELINKRHISVFISHIRFGLMLCFSIFILLYYLYANRDRWSVAEKGVALLTAGWLFYFMILLESATAFVAFGVLIGASLLWLLFRSGRLWMKLLVVACILGCGLGLGWYLQRIYHEYTHEEPIDFSKLEPRTVNGKPYAHHRKIPYRENGNRVWVYVSMEEMEKEWPMRSSIPFAGQDEKGQEIRYTAMRYLTSKGLRKDSLGLSQLSDADIHNIELGFTNYKYVNSWGVSKRVVQMLWEIEEYKLIGDANHASLIQRWIFFKMGSSIVEQNPLIGVGTGDLIAAYREIYEVDDQGLERKVQGISHNQFLTIAIVLGGLGLIWFMFALFYPLGKYYHDYLYVLFLALIVTSFMTDNTLDSQAGATLFAFFNAFLIVRREFSTAPTRA